jgi:hypothetical protein
MKSSIEKAIPSYMKPKASMQPKEEAAPKNIKPEGRLAAAPCDPILQRSFRGHKDTITSVGFNPNM